MRNKFARDIVHFLMVVVGLGLMIGGIMTGKYGATVIGLIVAAVSVKQWMHWNKNYHHKNLL